MERLCKVLLTWFAFVSSLMPFAVNAEIKNYRHIEGDEMVLGLTFEEFLTGQRERSIRFESVNQSVTLTNVAYVSSSPSVHASSNSSIKLVPSAPPLGRVALWLLAGIFSAFSLIFVVLPISASSFENGPFLNGVYKPLGYFVVILTVLGVPMLLSLGGSAGAYTLGLSVVVSVLCYSVKAVAPERLYYA